MKTKKISLFIFASFFFFGACSKPEQAAPTPAPVSAAKGPVYNLDRTASHMIMTVIKNGDTPVRGSFVFANGNYDAALGELKAGVDVFSWNSDLLERDARVRPLFFKAEAEGQVMMNLDFKAAEVGFQLPEAEQSADLASPVKVNFAGKSLDVPVRAKVQHRKDGRLIVDSIEPAAVRISEWGLDENLKTLMEACQHKSIDDVVKLEFHLEFARM